MILMNKIEFAKLNKEQMIIAFNNLKDDYSKLFNELEEKEEQMNIMSEAFDELEHQKQDYTQINILEMQLEEKDKIIDEMLNNPFFTGDCPYSLIGDGFIQELCDCDNCEDDYKKCWVKYFKNKILERGKNGK